MGFDMSYHPITETELKEWYFDVLEDRSRLGVLCERYGIDPANADKYKGLIDIALETTQNDSFDKTHAYYAAVAQGFFRTYFYIRDADFSSVIIKDPGYARYTRPWQAVLGREIAQPVKNQVFENYCGGVSIPPDAVVRLLDDIENDDGVRADVSEVFYDETLGLFIKALRYAKEHGLGILEAAEVIEPDPLNLNGSVCYSNLLNCDTEGALHYAALAQRQIAEAIAAHQASGDAQAGQQKQKGGFLKRFFGSG
jgi:hypothetical protein